jgi:hypothetical protein
MSTVSPQHANPKQTNDASTLTKDLLGVALEPETTVQSAPDATSSPSNTHSVRKPKRRKLCYFIYICAISICHFM